jgi:hypothetical protein
MPNTKTETSSIGVLALAAVVAFGLGFVALTKKDEKSSRDEKITLTAAFEPSPRGAPVHLQAHVGDALVAEELLTHSPWEITVTVAPGTQVSVHVNQETPGNMECAILRDGVPVSINTRADIGSIRCWHNRKS